MQQKLKRQSFVALWAVVNTSFRPPGHRLSRILMPLRVIKDRKVTDRFEALLLDLWRRCAPFAFGQVAGALRVVEWATRGVLEAPIMDWLST